MVSRALYHVPSGGCGLSQPLERNRFPALSAAFHTRAAGAFSRNGTVGTVLVYVSIAATFWDVYHSAMQTFGLGRIYDARTGNNPNKGRRLDAAFNLLILDRRFAWLAARREITGEGD